jgi:hypothetical protein
MADFRETLEVSKNNTCFLSYSFCKTKEDLAVEEGMLPNPPTEIDQDDCATIGEVVGLINSFSDTNDEACFRIQQLLDTGRISMVKEY